MMNQRIGDILRGKGEDVYSVRPLATVIDAVHAMNDNHVGSMLVLENGYPVGIFSERDVLVRVVAAQRDPTQTLVRDVMTTRLYTATPDDNVFEVMKLMTDKRCRHVPVMDGDRLVGVVSIGDLTKAMQSNLRQEVRELSNYIGGPFLS